MSSETKSKPEYPLPPNYKQRKRLHGLFRTVNKAKRIFIYSQLYLVGVAAFAVATVIVALSLPPNLAPVVIGLVTYAVYIGDRISDTKQDFEATAERAAFITRHRTFFSVSTATAYGLAVALAAFGGPFELAITLLPGTFWIFYASDWLPTIAIPMKRLKKILVLNSGLVAFAWAFSIVFLPLAFADAGISISSILLFIYFFVTVFVGTELSNIRDIQDDKQHGVSTIPNTFGIKSTRQVLISFGLLLVGMFGITYELGLFGAEVVLAVLSGLMVSFVLYSLIGRVNNHARLAVLEEMKQILVGILIISFSLI